MENSKETLEVFHGTSGEGVKGIEQRGFIASEASIPIDNQGIYQRITGVFVTPHRDIAHVYENNTRNGLQSKGLPRIISAMLEDAMIFDLTCAENQKLLLEYMKKTGKNINEFLTEFGYDGTRQIHKNDFGRIRLQYAITNKDKLVNIVIPKRGTAFMDLYQEATAPDWER